MSNMRVDVAMTRTTKRGLAMLRSVSKCTGEKMYRIMERLLEAECKRHSIKVPKK